MERTLCATYCPKACVSMRCTSYIDLIERDSVKLVMLAFILFLSNTIALNYTYSHALSSGKALLVFNILSEIDSIIIINIYPDLVGQIKKPISIPSL